jgi:hypothetical protein
MLSIDAIRQAQDRPREWLPIPEWAPAGETFDPARHGVYVGTMSGRDRDSYEAEILKRTRGDRADNVRALLAVKTVQAEDGSRLFTDADTDWLGDKACGPLSAILEVASRLNKFSKADQEELTKNS